ncbi:TIGR01244 family sulfur transferase [Alcanivorax sp.]|uniref:TIGR01244 family sulfur transferase n=1 Tax=Alcanivorax sp. TaxID=1872427 RepID=UPI0025BF8592|nr:TIGR01244 family sulfur transferase [Alcanivorax sp.]
MPTTKKLTDDLFVAAQLQPQDMAELAKAGFKMVINNRPDGEADDQPSSAEMAAAAEAAGLEYAHQPVVGSNISETDIDGFDAIVSLAETPVLAFCRTGTRCTTLWALSQADELDNDTILKTAADAGYDLSGLTGRLDQRRG